MFFKSPILAVETSCDETSASVICGNTILSNVVASQIELHQKWGGVVPEAAARAHVEALLPVMQEALDGSKLERSEIRAVAVTNRPGLVGALSVGVTAAKALSLLNQIPLIGIHHLEGHLCSLLATSDLPAFPWLILIASGGHTELLHVRALDDYEIVGETIDDAAGEAFDKGARSMGLPYPGGRAIEEQSIRGNPRRYPLPQSQLGKSFDFSFSGLKTAVLRLVETSGEALSVPDAAASLQFAIVNVLANKTFAAALQLRVSTVGLVGGVAANTSLRRRFAAEAEREGLQFCVPPMDLCTDNAAMIGLAASVRLARGEHSGYDLEVLSSERMGAARPTGRR